MPVILQTANYLALDDTSLPIAERLKRFKYTLLLESGNRCALWFHYIVSCLLSSLGEKEWLKLNPFANVELYKTSQELVTRTLLRATRIGQINRCLDDLRQLEKLMKKVEEHHADTSKHPGCIAEMMQKADTLANNMTSKRSYFDVDKGTFDPRFLVFEFQSSFILRKRQVVVILKLNFLNARVG